MSEARDRTRRDGETRQRVDELKASWDAAVVRLDARYKRAFALVILGLLVVVIGSAVGTLIFQGQRWDATRSACLRDNQRTMATVALLEQLGARERTIETTKVIFPHVPPLAHRVGDQIEPGPRPGYSGPMNCNEYANQRVGGLRIVL